MVVVAAGFFSWSIYMRYGLGDDVEMNTPLPALKFATLSGEDYNNTMLDKNKPLMIVYFSPGCEHCQDKTVEMVEKKNLFERAQILMVSPAKTSELEKFHADYKLGDLSNLIMLFDSLDYFYDVFGFPSYPTVYTYNKEFKLNGYFKGGGDMDDIAEHLFENSTGL